MISPAIIGPLPSIAHPGNPAHGGAAIDPTRRSAAPSSAESRPPEPVTGGQEVGAGQRGPQLDQAAEQANRGRVAEGDAAGRPTNQALAADLTAEQLRQLEQLKSTDREVRQHELAHQVAGGPYTGSPTYEYELGPDGQRYAVAGRVSVDYGTVTGDPQATIEKMNTVISAALAPADPSPADLQIAARARQNLLVAQLELRQQQNPELQAKVAGVLGDGGDETMQASNEPGSARDARVDDYTRIDAISSAAGGATSGQGMLLNLAA